MRFLSAPLTTLAAAWRAAGAARLDLWHRRTQHVPFTHTLNGGTSGGESLLTSVVEGDWELRLWGAADGAQPRLDADAALLAQLLRQQRDLHAMTGDLVEAQDQLLALYDLSRRLRLLLKIPDILTTLAQEALRLLRLAGARAHLTTEWHVSIPDPFPAEDTLSDTLTLPLVPGEGLAGTLTLYRQQGVFESPDIKLAQALVEQACAQLASAILYRESLAQERLYTELKLAAEIQTRLLPQTLPSVAGVEVFARSLPASQVGGDFYDVLEQGGGLLFDVGDVAGKGISAALLMVMSRTVLRSRVRSTAAMNPAVLLAHLNDDLYNDFSGVSMFATAFIGRYDTNSRRLTYANAGHAPVLYRPANADAYLLRPEHLPVGILEDSVYGSAVLDMRPGDLLLVASDGFSEARGDGGSMFGYERLAALLNRVAHAPVQQIGAAVFEEVAAFSAGHPQDDDQTLLIVKALP